MELLSPISPGTKRRVFVAKETCPASIKRWPGTSCEKGDGGWGCLRGTIIEINEGKHKNKLNTCQIHGISFTMIVSYVFFSKRGILMHFASFIADCYLIQGGRKPTLCRHLFSQRPAPPFFQAQVAYASFARWPIGVHTRNNKTTRKNMAVYTMMVMSWFTLKSDSTHSLCWRVVIRADICVCLLTLWKYIYIHIYCCYKHDSYRICYPAAPDTPADTRRFFCLIWQEVPSFGEGKGCHIVPHWQIKR